MNYEPGRTDGPGWHHDQVTRTLPAEAQGPPTPGGPWELACRVVRDYEFADPRIMRAYFVRDGAGGPAGRDMLLEGRFGPLRFPMGVRVDTEIGEIRTVVDGARCHVWGWSYQTLGDHLERGRLIYEVTKNAENGEVAFVITGVSRGARIANVVVRAGFRVFGRWTQHRFYRGCARRLARLVDDALRGDEPPVPRSAPTSSSPPPTAAARD